MSFIEELASLGVDTQEGLDRVLGDEEMYLMLVGMFIDSVNSSDIKLEEFDGAALDALTNKVHTLKGTTGNLSFTPLFTRYERALGLLRDGKAAEAKAVYQELLPIQNDIIECIQRNQ